MGNGINELAEPNDQNQPGGLERLRQDSKRVRDVEDGTNQSNSERRVSTISCLIGGTDFGKILGQLQELTDEYDSYTGAHKERLEARLKESEERRETFFKKADALREEILAAIARQAQAEEEAADSEE